MFARVVVLTVPAFARVSALFKVVEYIVPVAVFVKVPLLFIVVILSADSPNAPLFSSSAPASTVTVGAFRDLEALFVNLPVTTLNRV